MTTLQRFWAKVDASGGLDACWPYRGASTGHYGAFWDGDRQVGAHRYSLELSLGRPLTRGSEACHRCDNGMCVNPLHLFEGSRAENAADMVRKGRSAHNVNPQPGERNGRARLTRSDVDAIRASAETNAALGRRFGVSDVQIRRIRSGRQWAGALRSEVDTAVALAGRSTSELSAPSTALTPHTAASAGGA